MNIFFLDEDINKSVSYYVDSHVNKILLEIGQVLSTVHRTLDGQLYYENKNGRNLKRWKLKDDRDSALYKATHWNHPITKWVGETSENYLYTYKVFETLAKEFTFRFDKSHKTFTQLSSYVQYLPKHIHIDELIKFPCVVKPQFVISNDTITNYREYYRYGKTSLHKWTKRSKPQWL